MYEHWGFNPRPRVGGDRSCSRKSFTNICFNPRPRVGGDNRGQSFTPNSKGFNPRPRVGGDFVPSSKVTTQFCFNPRPRVGGDPGTHVDRWFPVVSIHAPAWGATPIVPTITPTADVSIHAPAWGATPFGSDDHHKQLFQSTPPRGGRPAPAVAQKVIIEFQSTPPRGGRLYRQ